MDKKTRYIFSISTNMLHRFIAVLVEVIILPYAILKLGKEAYAYVLIANSILGFLVITDLGVSSSITRFASHRDGGNSENEYLRAVSAGGLFVIGLISLIVSFVLAFSREEIGRFFDVPLDLMRDFHWLILFMAGTFFLRSISAVPRGLLMGINRYDVVNAVEITATLAKLTFIFLLFEIGSPSLEHFGLAVLLSQCIRFTGMAVNANALGTKGAIFSFSYLTFVTIKKILSFSSVNSLGMIGGMMLQLGPTFIIAKMLGSAMVTAFAPALLATNYLQVIIGTVTSPLVPHSGKDKATSGGDNLGTWSIKMGKYAFMIGLMITVPLSIYSDHLLHYWVGSEFIWVAPIFVVGIVSMAIASVQSATYFLVLGGGRIGALSISSLVFSVIGISVMIVGEEIWGWGLMGLAICLASTRLGRSLIFLPWYYCREFNIRLWNYYRTVYLVPLVSTLTPIIVAIALENRYSPANIYMLMLQMVFVVILIAIFDWRYCLYDEDKVYIKALVSRITQRDK